MDQLKRPSSRRTLASTLPKLLWVAVAVVVVWLVLLPLGRQLGVFRQTVTVDQAGVVEPRLMEPVTYEIITVLSKDAIPAILDPRLVKAEEAAFDMRADEQVLGVSISRCWGYPLTGTTALIPSTSSAVTRL